MQQSGYEPDNSDAETQLVGGAAKPAQPPYSPGPAAPGAGQPPMPPAAGQQPYPPAGSYPPGYPAAQTPAATPSPYDPQQYPAQPGYAGQGYQQPPGYGTPAPGYDYGQQAQQPGYDYGQGQQQAYPGYAPQPGYGTPAPGYDYGQQQAYGQQPGYGPGYPGAPQPPGDNNRRNLIIGAVAVALVVIILIVVLAVTLSSGGGKPSPNPTPSPSLTVPPTTQVPTPSPTIQTPSPTPTGFSAAEQALVNQLDPSAMKDCEPARDEETSEINAAVLCNAGDDGRGVFAFNFVNKTALQNDSSSYSKGITTQGDCKNGKDQVTTWSYDNNETTQGALLCSHTTDGSAYIRWYYTDKLLGFFATDKDGVALYTWWRNFEAVQQ
jgi:hypothetical protein